ncbi:Swt1 family HEPN domain-containing protein [Emergencia timonensis]|uniref:Swt1 family HEPN domain-containing protein n=1 Tax=Emergencia timonensis TaxID=1776384 RepID=UPI0039940277
MSERRLKEFVFNALLTQDSFSALENEGISITASDDYSPISRVVENDFSPRIWHDAVTMSSVYTALYCIENTIRKFIVERMSERYGIDWWEEKVPKKIKDAVNSLKKQEEKNKYHSNRSASEIGYTMLGNLGQIIIANWDDFSDIIPNQAWLNSRMDDLEMSRNIIMHTGILPVDETERIESIVRDLLRQIG